MAGARRETLGAAQPSVHASGTASIEIVDGVVPEYLQATKKYVGAEQWPAFEEQVRAMSKQQARITIVPEWAKLIDFETRVPTYMEELVEAQAPR